VKRIFLIALLIMTGSVATAGQPDDKKSGPAGKAEQELKQIEEARRQAIAKGDFKSLNEIYADDFSGIIGNGRLINREQLFAIFKNNDPGVTFTTDEISVRLFGETALFTGRLVGKTSDGEVVTASRFSHLFVKRHGKWQCVAGQSTAIPRQ